MAIYRTKVLTLRAAPEEAEELRALAKNCGQTLSEYVRESGLKRDLPPSRARKIANQDLLNLLSRVGNNLNQQTKIFHRLEHRQETPSVEHALAQLSEVRAVLAEVQLAVLEAKR